MALLQINILNAPNIKAGKCTEAYVTIVNKTTKIKIKTFKSISSISPVWNQTLQILASKSDILEISVQEDAFGIFPKTIAFFSIITEELFNSSSETTFLSISMNAGLNIQIPKINIQNTPIIRIWGEPLEIIITRENSIIPNIVTKCIDYLSQTKILQEEGLLRLAGSNSDVQLWQQKIENREEINFFSTNADPHSVADLLKRYLRALPQPLIPEKVSQGVVAILKCYKTLYYFY
eukprot:TRINITY_DN1026_c0_g1_i2.p1 TRINITY_DN1026_c0_g1~~TRINITY_DN1026_c0_g1_i2.p1  ORF type:complete len:235 (+),score=53.38 TRINITY_DN1026_c0_g1_i2:55-759(+)